MLNILPPAVYPGSFGLQILPGVFQDLHEFLCGAPIDIHLRQHNQDLVGFFTGLPIEQIMESVHHLVTQYAARQSADWSEISHTVQLAATEPKLRAFHGQFKRHKIKIWLKDLRQLCELSLHTSLISHIKKVFKQQRGSAIRNQISPSLANIAVFYLEHQWHQQHKDARAKHSDELYIVRYVDNRLVLCGQHLADRWFMQEFLADFFYRHPVKLGAVTNGELLGTILDANLRTLSFQQQAASFQVRPFRSAGTEAGKLSAAAAARICLASRYSFPDQQARSDVQQLVKSYLEYDYPATKLQQLATKFLQSRG